MESLSVRPLRRGWSFELGHLLARAESSIRIASAYVTLSGVRFLESHTPASVLATGALHLLTDLSPAHATQGATDPEALRALQQINPDARLVHLPRMHSKVYVVDDREAIVTSGNLTRGGLALNYEYGLHLRSAGLVDEVVRDLEDYASLGAVITPALLGAFCEVVRDAKTLAASLAPPGDQAQALEQKLQQAQHLVLTGYGSPASIQSVFQRSIVFLLRRDGPLNTPDLHERIRVLHPDLCGEENRVIGGRSFGRKWKHAVRTAQQHLKQSGAIRLDGDRWVLVS